MSDIFHMRAEPENGVTFDSLRTMMPGMRTESREVGPGVWEHTFTPEHTLDLNELIYGTPTAPTGMLNEADINAMIEQMFASAREQPHMLYVSVEDMRRIRHADRIGRLYRACPVPRGKIRKCHLRRLQTRWRAGKAHIWRVEAAERGRKEAEMRRLEKSHGSKPVLHRHVLP